MTTLPNFLMIGAAKSGTSSLYAYLRQHPQVFLSEIRECEFFALEGQTLDFKGPGDRIAYRRYVTTLENYQALFKRTGNRAAVGECSDLYLYSPAAAKRIRHYLPGAKLIVMLRNPVDRAHSQYRQFVRDGREPLRTFEEALAAEETRIASDWHPHWHLKTRGFYSSQIETYLGLFPREQLAIHLYDDFESNPSSVIQALFSFLEVDPTFVPDMSLRYNISGTPRSRLLHAVLARPLALKDLLKPVLPASVRHRVRARLMNRNLIPERTKMAQETRSALTSLYRDDVLRLQALIGRDLSGWLTASK
jgi:hypothetical protein